MSIGGFPGIRSVTTNWNILNRKMVQGILLANLTNLTS